MNECCSIPAQRGMDLEYPVGTKSEKTRRDEQGKSPVGETGGETEKTTKGGTV